MEAGSAKTAVTSGDAILEEPNNIASRSIVRSNSHNFPTRPPEIQMNRHRIRPRMKTILTPAMTWEGVAARTRKIPREKTSVVPLPVAMIHIPRSRSSNQLPSNISPERKS